MRLLNLTRAAARAPTLACAVTLVLLGGCVLGTEDAVPDVTEDVEDTSVFDFGVEEPPPKIELQLSNDKEDGTAAPALVTFTVNIGTLDPKDFIFKWDFQDGDSFEEKWEDDKDAKALLTMQHEYKYKGQYCAKLDVIWRKQLSVRKDAQSCVDVIQPAELILSTVKLESSEVVGLGDPVTLSFEIDNEGDAVVEPFETAVFLSKDATLDKAALLVHKVEHEGMDSGLTGVVTLSFTDDNALSFNLPAGVPNGHFWIFVHVDHLKKINEFNDLDNLRYANTLLEVNNLVAAKPNLTVTKPTLTSANKSYSPGDQANYEFFIKNVGEGEAKNFKFSVFLSKDKKLDYLPGVEPEKIDINTHDRPITDAATTSVKSLIPGASLKLTRGLSVPPLPDGTYHLIAKIDTDEQVTETSEDDNIAVGDKPLVIKKVIVQGWDLELVEFAVVPKGSFLGGTVAIKYTIKNLGNINSPKDVPATVYFCPNKGLTKPLCQLNKTTFTVPSLVPAQTKGGQQNVSIDKNTPVQKYSVHLQVDPQNKYPPPKELEKGNNTKKIWPFLITATAKVDFKPENIGFHPQSVTAGQVIKVAYKISNLGTHGSGVTKTAIAVSQGTQFSRAAAKSGVNIVLAKINEDPVEAQATVYRAAKIVVPLGLDHLLPTHNLGVILDIDDEEGAESPGDAANNGAPSNLKLTVKDAKGGCYEDGHDKDGKKNNKKDEAAVIKPGVTSGLALCGAEDWYKVSMQKGHSLFVTMKASELLWTSPIPADLDLDLVTPDGKILDSVKSLGLAKKASALTVPATADYLIRIYPHTAAVQAHYTLDVKVEGPPSGVDLFASHLTAGPTATFPGGLVKTTLALTNLGDKQATAFTVRYMLSTDSTITEADTKLADVIFDDGLGAAASTKFKRNLVLPVVKGGKYYIGALIDADGKVSETDEKNNNVTSNSIQLNSQISCATDSFSGNHTVDEAADISPTTKCYTKLNVCPGLEDWFAIKMPQGKALAAEVKWKHAPGNGIIGLQIVDPTKTSVVAGSANPQQTKAKLPYLQVGGTYYFHTYVLPEGAKMAQPYDYELCVTASDPDPSDVCLPDVYESNGSSQTAKELGCGLANLTLCKGDQDWFYLDMTKGEKVILDLNHPGSPSKLEIYDNPNTKAIQTLTGSGKLNFTANADGKYYMRIGHKEDKKPPQGFGYSLKVDGGKGVDLLPQIDSLFPTKLPQNDDVFVSTKISNECKTDAGAFDYCYWFSTDNKLDKKDTLMLKKSLSKGLLGKTSVTVDDKAAIPADAKTGSAFVIVEADCSKAVKESQELNNVDASGLTVVELCLPDILEPNPGPNFAAKINTGKNADLSLCPYDLDWYQFEAKAGETISVSLDFDTKKGDLDVRLYEVGKFGWPVATAKTKNVPEQLVYTTKKSTKYYVRVNGFAGQTNTYDLYLCKKVGGSCFECTDSKQCDFAKGDFCDPKGKCQSLGCTIGDDKTCDDGNSCTVATCKAGVGCAKTVLTAAPCSDGDACTLGESCTDKGVCVASSKLQVTDAKTLVHGHGSTLVGLPGDKLLLAGDAKGADGKWRSRMELHHLAQTVWELSYEVTGTMGHHLADALKRSDAAEIMAVGSAQLAMAATPTAGLLVRAALDTGKSLGMTVIGGAGKHRDLAALVQTGAGLFAAAGQANAAAKADGIDGWLVSLQPDGKIMWELRAGGVGADALHDVAVASDGTLLAVGVDRDAKTAEGGWVVGVSPKGKLLWSKNLAAGGTQSTLWSIVAGKGDTVAVGGGSDLGQTGGKPEPFYQAWIAWLSGSGFAKEPALAGSAILPATTPQDAAYKGTKVSQVFDLAWAPAGGLVAAGMTGATKGAKGGIDGAIWTVDSSKKLSKTFPFGGPGFDVLRSLLTADGAVQAFGTADLEGDKGPRWYNAGVTPPKTDCNDGNPCTIDACKAATGCMHEAVKDGQACGIGLACKAGVCQ